MQNELNVYIKKTTENQKKKKKRNLKNKTDSN